ncbi:CDPK13 [Auxenochlorella protothecoides x Auxenochlorella symbiontica]|uniref:Uncharacterized protein n=1 Tax=Auxenochlorella protothecoides TaxID=3075 RepID=A0A1D1ZPB9_AUXPR
MQSTIPLQSGTLHPRHPLPYPRACQGCAAQLPPLDWSRLQRRRIPGVASRLVVRCARTDYTAKAGDVEVLKKPLKSELKPSELVTVFGFPRDFDTHYAMGDMLGAGSFGVVRQATENQTGNQYAVKSIMKIPKNGRPTPRYLIKLQTEVDAMRQLGASLDAVHLKDVFEDELSIHLVMELCEGGSVLDGLQQGDYSERQVQHIMRSVMRFLAQSHSKGIIYRDVKPDNFLAKDKNWAKEIHSETFLSRFGRAVGLDSREEIAPSDSPIKATDFGLAMRHRAGEPPLKSRSGTPAYMAPEVIQQCYGLPADIWSAGTMMYQLLTGKFPFWDSVKDCTLQDVWKAILSQQVNFTRPELQQVSTSARGLLMAMLERDPRKRITAAKALEHPWLKEDLGSDTPRLRASVVQRLQRFATHGQLKQLVLRTLTEAAGVDGESAPPPIEGAQEWLRSVRVLFDELDVDSSGTVSIQELSAGLEALGFDVSPGEMEVLMARIDTDRDGGLQLSEFVASLVDWGVVQRHHAWQDWVRAVFDRLDKDGNGFITLDEIAEELGDYKGKEDSLIAARRMLREADANGDGQVSWSEFVELLEATDDDLNQYDSRLKRYAHDVVDEDLSTLDSLHGSGSSDDYV